MNSPDLTRWLLRVRDALAEYDEIKRDSMLRAADRFLKRSNQQVLVFRRIRIGETGRGRKSPLVQPKQGFEPDAKELTEPKKQPLRKGLFDECPVTHRPGSGACSFRLAE